MILILTLQLGAQWGITIGILLFLLGLFLFENRMMRKKAEDINKWTALTLYIINFLILIGAIIALLQIWEVDIGLDVSLVVDQIVQVLRTSVRQIVLSLIAIFAISFVSKVVRIGLNGIGKKQGPSQRRRKTIAKLMISLTRYTLGVIGIIIVLSIWGVNVLPALAGLGILGLVIGLGAQKFINDLINGFFIIFEQHFDVGDVVEIGGFKGVVIDLGLKTTRVQNFKGDIRIVANGQITSLTNHSKNPSLAIVDFRIAYQEDIGKTIDLLNTELIEYAKTLPEVIELPTVLGVMGLGASGVDLRVTCKTINEQHYAVERMLRQKIKELLDKNNIEIPFPQVVVHQSKP